MAGKVPVYRNKRQAPGSTGNVAISDSSGLVTRPLDQLGREFTALGERRLAKDLTAETLKLDNVFSKESQKRMDDDALKRQGGSALADKELGTDDVYTTYENFGTKYIDEAVSNADPRFADAIRNKLTTTFGQYQDRFGAFQLKQTLVYRENETYKALENGKTTVKRDITAGIGSLDKINTAIAEGVEAIRASSGGKNTLERELAYANSVTEQSITQAAGNETAEGIQLAKDLLANENLTDTLSVTQSEALGNFIEQKETDLLVKSNINSIIGTFDAPSGLDYPGQLATADKIKNTEVQKRVKAEIRNREAQRVSVENTNVNKVAQDFYKRIFEGGEQFSTLDIDSDPALVGQSNTKLMIKSWLSKGETAKLGHLNAGTRLLSKHQMLRDINMGLVDEDDVLAAWMPDEDGNSSIDIRDVDILVKEAKSFKLTNGVSYTSARKIYMEKGGSKDSYDKQSQVMDDIQTQILAYKRDGTGDEPPRSEVERFVREATVGIAPTRYFTPDTTEVNEAQELFPNVTGGQAGKSDPLEFRDRKILDYRINGVEKEIINGMGDKEIINLKFPDAKYVEPGGGAANYYFLGEPTVPDGFVYGTDRKGNLLPVRKEIYLRELKKGQK